MLKSFIIHGKHDHLSPRVQGQNTVISTSLQGTTRAFFNLMFNPNYSNPRNATKCLGETSSFKLIFFMHSKKTVPNTSDSLQFRYTMEDAPITAESAVDMIAASVEQVITVTKKYWKGPLSGSRSYSYILLMEEILHQLRLVVYPNIYEAL